VDERTAALAALSAARRALDGGDVAGARLIVLELERELERQDGAVEGAAS